MIEMGYSDVSTLHIDWSAVSAIAAAVAILAAVWAGRQPGKVAEQEIARRQRTAGAAIAGVLRPMRDAAIAVSESAAASGEVNMPDNEMVRSLFLRAAETRERLTKFDEVWRDLSVEQHNAFLESQVLAAKLEKNSEEWLKHWSNFRTQEVLDRGGVIENRGRRLSEIITVLESAAT